jgi:membrane fusion protein, multidrug efflux system
VVAIDPGAGSTRDGGAAVDASRNTMRKNPLFGPPAMWLALVAAALVAGACAGGKTGASEGPDDGAKGDAEERQAPPVEVAVLALGPMEAVLRFSADLEAERSVPVHSAHPASRRLVRLLVEEGDRVAPGQLLARLEADEPTNALARVSSQIEKARLDHDRQRRLYEQQLVSEQVYTEGRHQLEQLEIAMEDARRQLSYTEIRSPLGGTVTTRAVKVGDQVSLNQQLFEVVAFDSLVVRVYVPERELARVRVGQEVRLTSLARPGEVFPARVARIAPVVDPRSGTVRVTLDVPYRSGLLPGMFLDVAVVTDVRSDALRVPKRALVLDRDQAYVYRLQEDGRVERVQVQPVLEDSEFVEVRTGLTAGERVVVAGQAGLKPGVAVRVVGERS